MKKALSLLLIIVLLAIAVPYSSAAAQEGLSFRRGTGFSADGDYIIGIADGDTVGDLLSSLESAAGVSVFGKDGAELTGGRLGTGFTVSLLEDGKPVRSYKTVLVGDLDGSGDINSTDIIIAKRVVLGISEASGEILRAFDANRDGNVSVSDYVALRRGIKGEYDIANKRVETPETEAMTVYKSAPDELTLSCSGGALLTFSRTTNGPWNLADWGNGSAVTVGGYSWEYVLRSSPAADGEPVWSGCGFGNETLVEVVFTDGSTGERFVPSSSKRLDIQNFRLTEKTLLNRGDPDSPFCEVTRNYTVVGGRIDLTVSYRFISDSYMSLSYMTLTPVYKNGQVTAIFTDINGDKTSVVPDGNTKMYDGNSSVSCVVTAGNGSVTTEIYSRRDTVGDFKGSFGAALWDMNASNAAVCFGRFENGAPELVAAGTEWNTAVSWKLG